MRITEKVAVLLFIIAAVLKFFGVTGGAILSTLSGLTLMIIYMLFGFALFNGIRTRQIFKSASYVGVPGVNIIVAIISGLIIGSGVAMVLFHVNHWPGAAIMTYSLLVELAVIFVVAIIMASRKILVGRMCW